MLHELKTVPPYWARVADRTKTFEVRKADRDFQTGDALHLREWDPGKFSYSGKYTGRELTARITYIYDGDGLAEGMRVLALADVLVTSWGPAEDEAADA
jgi:hypothetical protein